MRTTILFLLISLAVSGGIAQNPDILQAELFATIDDTPITRNLSFGVGLPVGRRFVIAPAIRIHLNSNREDAQGNLFKNRFRAGRIPEFLGLCNDIRYQMPIGHAVNSWFLFHHSQLTYMGLKGMNVPAFLTLDQTVGAGLMLNISGQLFLSVKGGAGGLIVFRKNTFSSGYARDPSLIGSLGVHWVL